MNINLYNAKNEVLSINTWTRCDVPRLLSRLDISEISDNDVVGYPPRKDRVQNFITP